jgi:coenzyme F420 hydrogenase subunit beta
LDDKYFDYSVINKGLCTGCGTCVGICPSGAIEMVLDKKRGIYLPRVVEAKCIRCGLCSKVCPGLSVDFTAINQSFFNKQPEDVLLGNCSNCYTGFSNNQQLRFDSSSGGLISSLLIFALDEGLINGAIVTRLKKDNPLQPESFIAKTSAEIIDASGSKYCPVSSNVVLKEILKEDGHFAVVGLPCHIHGIRKAEMVNDSLRRKISLHFGLFCCGHTDTFFMTEYLLRRYGIEKDNITKLEYRGGGWPGNLKFTLINGYVQSIPFKDYIRYHNFHYFCPQRCSVCYDGTNDLADISFGDAWFPEFSNDKEGVSVVISRNEIGESLIKKSIAKRVIIMNQFPIKMIRNLDSKKREFQPRVWISLIIGRKYPSYNIAMPRSSFISFIKSLFLFSSAMFSNRHLWWIIEPVSTIITLFHRIGKKLINM